MDIDMNLIESFKVFDNLEKFNEQIQLGMSLNQNFF
jgi:hypothetical protein